MPSQTRFAGTITTEQGYPFSSSGVEYWASPELAGAEDGNVTIADIGGHDDGYTEQLKCVNFGFSIPTGATIDGVVVEVMRKANIATRVVDHYVQLQNGGFLIGVNKADIVTQWGTSLSLISYGSSSDIWSATLTDSIVNATTYGIAFSAQLTTGTTDRGADVDFIRMTVYYTQANGGPASQPVFLM